MSNLFLRSMAIASHGLSCLRLPCATADQRAKPLHLASLMLFLALFDLSNPATATTIVEYTDASAFSSATTQSIYETYSGFAPAGGLYNLGNKTVDGISYANSYNYVYVFDSSYEPYFNWGTGAVLSAVGTTTLTFAPVTAFGIYLGYYGNNGDAYSVPISSSVAGQSFDLQTSSSQNLVFYGFVSDTPFTSFTITNDDTGGGQVIADNVTLGAVDVYEPASSTLLASGLIGMSLAGRRRWRRD